MPHAGLGRLDPEESRWIAFDRVRCPHEWELYSSEESGNDEDDEDHDGPDVLKKGEQRSR